MSLARIGKELIKTPNGTRTLLTAVESDAYWKSALESNQEPKPSEPGKPGWDESDWIEHDKNQKPPQTPTPPKMILPSSNPQGSAPPPMVLLR